KVSLLRKAYQSKTSKKDLAQTENISRTSLYQWKDEYLGKDFPFKMKEPTNKKEELLKEIKTLQKQVQDLQLEKALLEKAAEILKKD
ncbi:transposase, partial [Liquorilactobacillus vini]|uniref:transposase n=1 Tax=Liquorilactobacillus vini TaxID=238015 RepID=UPI00055479DA